MDRGTEGEERFFVSREINEWANLSDKVIFLIFTISFFMNGELFRNRERSLKKSKKAIL